jgi:hypothetical protein
MRDALIAPGYPLSLALTFDEDEEFAVECYQIISRLRRDNSDLRELVVSIGFADDRVYPALQAADILAHFTHERLVTGQIPELLHRLATPESGSILLFDGGEMWDESVIDRNWKTLRAAEDMPRKNKKRKS